MQTPSEEILSRLAQRCAAAGIPLTPQRRAVMEVLAGRDDHPTVDQIYLAVAARMPEVSRATVYRSLSMLVSLGLLQRVDHPGSAVRFDANVEPHHHFLCTTCGSIRDLPLEAVQGFDQLVFQGASPLRADEVSLVVRGSCGCTPDPETSGTS